MFKMLNPRRFYHAVGRRKFLEFVLLAVFVLFFYGPLLNMLMLALFRLHSPLPGLSIGDEKFLCCRSF